MPKIFRALSKKRNKWFWDDPPLPWLEQGDIPAGPLEHMIPQEHRLSVFVVNDEQARIDRVATAIAAGRNEFSALEFIVFDESVLNEVEIETDRTVRGATYDPDVNSWHYDLINVSANKLVALMKRILPVTVRDLVLEKRIVQVFKETAKSKEIDWNAVKVKEKKELQRELLENRG